MSAPRGKELIVATSQMKRSQPAAAPTEWAKETWALQFEPAAVLLPNAEPIARGHVGNLHTLANTAHTSSATRFSQPLRTLAPFMALNRRLLVCAQDASGMLACRVCRTNSTYLKGDKSRAFRSLSGAFWRAGFCVFKSSPSYFAKATAPCVVAYRYARIRRLVRLGAAR